MNGFAPNLGRVLRHYLKWIAVAAAIGAACGLASALFLRALELATSFRESHPPLLWLLPVGGLLVGWLYRRFGEHVESGSNLIIDEFHSPRRVVPLRMAPLVLAGTILTHLFGGSAGREGTAVQMGASLADQFTHLFKMRPSERRGLLMAGMSGGFASVFGVPFAGAIFGAEVLAAGQVQVWGLVECATAAFTANAVCLALGATHAHFPAVGADAAVTAPSALLALAAGAAFGSAARLFARLVEAVAAAAKRAIPNLPLRAMAGGALLALLYALAPPLQRYAGLGTDLIAAALSGAVPAYDWLGKTALTALTLGTGFKGGEVTPLLVVGATGGNALGAVLPLPRALLAALGFVAVFAGAANTPLACTAMAMELFGAPIGPLALLACLASFAVSGRRGIYGRQRRKGAKERRFVLARPKLDDAT